MKIWPQWLTTLRRCYRPDRRSPSFFCPLSLTSRRTSAMAHASGLLFDSGIIPDKKAESFLFAKKINPLPEFRRGLSGYIGEKIGSVRLADRFSCRVSFRRWSCFRLRTKRKRAPIHFAICCLTLICLISEKQRTGQWARRCRRLQRQKKRRMQKMPSFLQSRKILSLDAALDAFRIAFLD